MDPTIVILLWWKQKSRRGRTP